MSGGRSDGSRRGGCVVDPGVGGLGCGWLGHGVEGLGSGLRLIANGGALDRQLRRHGLRRRRKVAGLRVGLWGVGIGDLAWDFNRRVLHVVTGFGLATAHLGVGVLGSLAAGRGAGLGHFALFAAGSSFGLGDGLSPAGGFDTFCGSDAGGLFGLAQGLLVGKLGLSCLVGHSDFLRLAGGSFGSVCGGFGVGLGAELEFARLFGGTVAELGAVLTAGRGEVPVFGAVEVGPGVEDSDVFRCLYGGQLFDSLFAAGIHDCRSYGYW